jgi:hypothetical protein
LTSDINIMTTFSLSLTLLQNKLDRLFLLRCFWVT